MSAPAWNPSAAPHFVINAAAGSSDADAKRAAILAALQAQGREGRLHFCKPADLVEVAQAVARQAQATGAAMVAVGGDGTINTVANAAHSAGCAMGVVPQGTFNYFARTHGIPADPTEAVAFLLAAQPVPVQVAALNEQVFLVNASLGLYPELLEDRESFKARFGRSRGVAFIAACKTLLRAQRQLKLHIETAGRARDVKTLTLFVGNNRLQLEQLGAEPADTIAGTPGDGSIAALMLRPIGTVAMVGLTLHGAMGRLGEAAGVEQFEFHELTVRPSPHPGRRGIKVAFDGEVTTMPAPLVFRVHPRPLHLLMAPQAARGPLK